MVERGSGLSSLADDFGDDAFHHVGDASDVDGSGNRDGRIEQQQDMIV